MTGNFGLRFAENFLQVANAERSVQKQMHDTQARAVA